jgi:inner membrane protein
LERRFESVSVKGIVIAALNVLMLWPLSQVENLVNERQVLQHDAYAVIAEGFGSPQVVGPPVLSVETEQRTATTDSSTKSSTDLWTAGATLHLAPDDVEITSDVAVEIPAKGSTR